MNKKKLILGLMMMILSVGFGAGSKCLGRLVGGTAEGHRDIETREGSDYEYRVGRRLADAVIRNESMLVGTVHNVVAPAGKRSSDQDDRALSFEKVTLGIDEWLAGQPKTSPAEIQLNAVPLAMGLQYGSEWRGAPWERVNLEVGGRLLIAFSQPGDETGRLAEIKNYTLVVSDESLFSAIREVLAWHRLALQNPTDALDAAEIINSSNRSIFTGYFVIYLWRGGSFGDVNVDALALGRLLGKPNLSDISSFYVVQGLSRRMFSESRPLSEATRHSLAEELVIAATSERPAVAKNAFGLLLRLSDKKLLNIRPFLTGERRRKLIQTYQMTLRGDNKQRHSDFESQLGWVKSP